MNSIDKQIIKRHLPNNQYFPAAYKKNGIVLHHTVSSSVASAERWWASTPDRIATAYIIGRDGIIVEKFPPECWAHHLGLRSRNNTSLNRQTIGIEMVNEGFLFESSGVRWLHPDGPLFTGTFQISDPWRGGSFWPVYTPAQVIACAALTRFLARTYLNQPKITEWDIAPPLVYDPKTPDKHKIWFHHSVRTDKTDPSPAFPYAWFSELIRADNDPILRT